LALQCLTAVRTKVGHGVSHAGRAKLACAKSQLSRADFKVRIHKADVTKAVRKAISQPKFLLTHRKPTSTLEEVQVQVASRFGGGRVALEAARHVSAPCHSIVCCWPS